MAIKRLRHARPSSRPSAQSGRLFVDRRSGRCGHRLRRASVPRVDRAHPQSSVLRPVRAQLRRHRVHAGIAVGRAGDPGSRRGRPWRRVPGAHVCARGARRRRARSDGRDLLQRRPHPPGGRGGEIGGVGARHRLGRGGGARGPHHPDRFVARLQYRPGVAAGKLAAHHAASPRARARALLPHSTRPSAA